jgi:hypothetical protein
LLAVEYIPQYDPENKLIKHITLALVLAAGVTTARAAESAFVIHLEGMEALCSITGSAGMAEASEIKRRLGSNSPKYRARIEKAFADADKCVERVKEETKSMFRGQVAEYPALRQPLTDAYAAWLGVIDWVRMPREFGDDAPGLHVYRAAINRLKAEFAAM